MKNAVSFIYYVFDNKIATQVIVSIAKSGDKGVNFVVAEEHSQDVCNAPFCQTDHVFL